MDGNTGTLMLLLEALKSNKGQFISLLFALSHQTLTSGDNELQFLTQPGKKRNKELYHRTCFKYFIFEHNFQIVQDELISCYLTKPIFFSLSKHNVPMRWRKELAMVPSEEHTGMKRIKAARIAA